MISCVLIVWVMDSIERRNRRKVTIRAGLDNIVLETDSPFCQPSEDIERNEPKFVPIEESESSFKKNEDSKINQTPQIEKPRFVQEQIVFKEKTASKNLNINLNKKIIFSIASIG